jgi:membrane protease YdiL (CAAX protease family)
VLERIQHVRFIIPHTAAELRLFTAVSITAGICEELLYRGFLIGYLSHWMGVIQAALLSSLLFGVAHLYQGLRGILLTGAIGVFMSGIYLVSGSLYLPMIIHAAVDLSSGRAGYDALRAEAASEAERDREAGSA